MQPFPSEILDLANQKQFNLDHYSNDSSISCFSEVDLDYSDELHDLDNDYLLASENLKVTEEGLSKCQLKIIEYNNFSLGQNKKRLIINLSTIGKQKLHYRILKLCLYVGLQLKTFIEYQNSNKNHFKNHISNAIKICKEKQKKKVTKSKKKKIAKLCYNATFGKLTENPLTAVDVYILNNTKLHLK